MVTTLKSFIVTGLFVACFLATLKSNAGEVQAARRLQAIANHARHVAQTYPQALMALTSSSKKIDELEKMHKASYSNADIQLLADHIKGCCAKLYVKGDSIFFAEQNYRVTEARYDASQQGTIITAEKESASGKERIILDDKECTLETSIKLFVTKDNNLECFKKTTKATQEPPRIPSITEYSSIVNIYL